MEEPGSGILVFLNPDRGKDLRREEKGMTECEMV